MTLNIKRHLKGFGEEVKDVEIEPLDDSDIRFYLGPRAKILTYPELANYTSIFQILTKPKDFFILLYLDAPNKGHWTCVLRYNKTIEFFDSYGIKVDDELKWLNCRERQRLKMSIPFLTRLFNRIDESMFQPIYNSIKYQTEKGTMNTCGRHCIFRILKMLENDMDCDEYYAYMEKLRKKFNITYDEIVSTMTYEL
jgi:hypothetical protein